ncbi:MAG: glycosyltransferase family 2 protein [Anaerolineae bacterium]|nr:glycosyltransferase family 2 protein [Anaerolineae bacterium]
MPDSAPIQNSPFTIQNSTPTPTASDPLVSVVVINWNGAHHLPTCLDALRAQTYPHREVLVADNASTDGSQALVRDQYPEVKLVALDENRGFTGGNNAGIAASTGEIVILLNNDTEADPGWIAAVVDAFNRHPDAGLVASKLLLFDRRDTFHTAGDFYRLDGLPGNRGVWQRDEGQYDREEYVFGACGGALSVRRTVLDQVGLLDDDFFFSAEDVDLCWRVQLAGWRCVYTPDAVVFHRLAATGGDVTASFYNGRNFLYLLAKDYPTDLWRRHWRKVVRRQGIIAWEALRAWRGEAARARLRGQIAGLRGLPKLLRKRRAVQATRRVSLAYLESILTSPDAE